MNRRQFLKLTAAIAATDFLRCFALAAEKSAPKKLNFVFILIDDMGYTDAGCYGSTFYETPNIDKLAAQGMRFTNAYTASPVCSPTRASIFTGKHPARLNLTDWIPGLQNVRPQPHKLIPPDFAQQVPLSEFTLAEAFKHAGYYTCFVGKWHLGSKPYYPTGQGFDVNVAGNDKGHPPAGYFSPYHLENLEDGPDREYLTDRLTDQAVKFLDDTSDKPFLLFLSHYAVHTPIQAKQNLIQKYRQKAAGLSPSEAPTFVTERSRRVRQVQNDPTYAAMLESVDHSIGEIIKKLQQLGLAENTVVIFTSDNGGLSTASGSPTSNVPLRAGKGWLYEGGIRVPLIIKWPGTVTPGTVCHEPVISHDFYPTMLEMALLPLRPDQHADGLSLVPLLKQSAKLDRNAIYWHYPHYHGSGNTPSAAVRAGHYKLIEFYDEGQVELYNLKNDISEKNNLAAKMPEKTAQLKKMLRDWQKSLDAQMPQPSPGYKAKTEN